MKMTAKEEKQLRVEEAVAETKVGDLVIFGDGFSNSVWIKSRSGVWRTHQEHDNEKRTIPAFVAMIVGEDSTWAIS